MAQQRRVRRVLKWLGAAVCLLILTAGLLSAFLELQVESARVQVVLLAGNVTVVVFPSWVTPSQSFEFKASPMTEGSNGFVFLWPQRAQSRLEETIIPLWFLLAFAGIATGILWRCDRFPPGHCPRCGYDLTGNVTGRCPECGASCLEPSVPA